MSNRVGITTSNSQPSNGRGPMSDRIETVISDEAAEVIARERYAREHYLGEQAPAWDTLAAGHAGMIRGASADLAALEAAGYVVVKLPGPVRSNGVDKRALVPKLVAEVERLQAQLEIRERTALLLAQQVEVNRAAGESRFATSQAEYTAELRRQWGFDVPDDDYPITKVVG